jgi:hypothetical protein
MQNICWVNALHATQNLIEKVLHMIFCELVIANDDFIQISFQQVGHNVDIFKRVAISWNQNVDYFQDLSKSVDNKRTVMKCIHCRDQSNVKV